MWVDGNKRGMEIEKWEHITCTQLCKKNKSLKTCWKLRSVMQLRLLYI